MNLKKYLESKMEEIPTWFLEHMKKHEGKLLNSKQIPEGFYINILS